MLPQLGTQPGATRRKRPPTRAIHRCSYPPQISVLVKHPAAAAVVFFGHLAALIHQFFDHLDEGLHTFWQVARFRRPVVHLRVDVGGVFGIPGGVHVVVPDALQVGGLGARA